MTSTPREVFLRLVHGVADGKLDELPELYAEQTDVRHPMSDTAPLRSRNELRTHFVVPPGATMPERRPVDIVVHETVDDEVIVAEFAYEFLHEDSITRVPCVFVMRVRDGVIVESRDYIDPIRRSAAARQR
ncbi:MAG: ketosteroid isomerase [Pseudonocardiales bacterium]|nr:MAG: ketosteroid isomerase [Pseudonocardiales bacterium]